MPDSRFHRRSGRFSLSELASLTGASLSGTSNPDMVLEDVASLDRAGAKDLSFFDNIRYRQQFIETKAGACIVSPEMQDLAPTGVSLLLTAQPYKAYALAAQAFYPEEKPANSIISDKAAIASDAKIGKNCVIEPGVVIGSGAEISDFCRIGANAVIGAGVVIGKSCRIGACTSISHSVIGEDVHVYPGARIGQDGFGFAIDPAGHVKVPQLGRVIIGDHVEIGANTTIDRGAGPDTEIGAGTWIDNLVQIGHNVKIGRGCVIVSQAGISGSTVLEDYVVLAGQAGLTGHLKIGRGARIGAQAGVMRDVAPGEEMLGSPAVPLRQALRQTAFLNRLIKKRS